MLVHILQKSTSHSQDGSSVSPCVLPPLYPPPDWSTNHCGNIPKKRLPRITIQGKLGIISPTGVFFLVIALLNLANLIRAIHEYQYRKQS
jgi:hypothetical protein